MPQIRIEQPGAAPVLRVLSGSETTLGRAEDNDVVLVADEVSRHHAKLCIRGGRVLLMDLNSLNGTYVNRQQIVERVLSHQDEIWFGSKCRILFDENPKIASRTANELPEPSSVLVNDLARIREDMARVGNNMTLIGKAGQAARAGDETPSASKEELVAMGRAYRRLAALYQASNQVSRLIASNADLPTRLAAVLDTAIEVAEAERGFVMLRDEQSGGLLVHLAREMGQELKASSPSMSIASRAASMGEPVLMRDSALDEQFGSSDSIIAQRIHSAMCAPLQVEDRILGSIYVDTRQPEHMFQEEDLELFASLAAQSAMAIENVRLSEQMLDTEKKRANLGRFLSPAIVEAIMNEDKELELGGRKQEVTALFCDIRGFTPIAEQLAPAVLVEMLNEHFTALVDIIFRHQGTLDKYIGDAIMAVFGAPIAQEDDACRAIQAAVAMQRKNAELNKARMAAGRPCLEIGIGINSGEVVAGYFGAPERMEFTIVGDEVNVASRLCSMAGAGQIVAAEATYARVRGRVEAASIGEMTLKGRTRPVSAFEILGTCETPEKPAG